MLEVRLPLNAYDSWKNLHESLRFLPLDTQVLVVERMSLFRLVLFEMVHHLTPILGFRLMTYFYELSFELQSHSQNDNIQIRLGIQGTFFVIWLICLLLNGERPDLQEQINQWFNIFLLMFCWEQLGVYVLLTHLDAFDLPLMFILMITHFSVNLHKFLNSLPIQVKGIKTPIQMFENGPLFLDETFWFDEAILFILLNTKPNHLYIEWDASEQWTPSMNKNFERIFRIAHRLSPGFYLNLEQNHLFENLDENEYFDLLKRFESYQLCVKYEKNGQSDSKIFFLSFLLLLKQHRMAPYLWLMVYKYLFNDSEREHLVRKYSPQFGATDFSDIHVYHFVNHKVLQYEFENYQFPKI